MTPVDRQLAQHGRLCRRARGRWFAVRGAAETLREWLAPRVLSSAMLLALLLGGLSWLLR